MTAGRQQYRSTTSFPKWVGGLGKDVEQLSAVREDQDGCEATVEMLQVVANDVRLLERRGEGVDLSGHGGLDDASSCC